MAKNTINDIEFLNCIYKNAQMGLIGIKNVIKYTKNTKLKRTLAKEYYQYEKIVKAASNLLNEEKESIGLIPKITSAIMVDITLLKDNSTSRIAKMMLEGTNKGIIEIVAKINAYNGMEAKILTLAKQLKTILENNVKELSKYL